MKFLVVAAFCPGSRRANIFVALFASLLKLAGLKFRPNFALGDYGHKMSDRPVANAHFQESLTFVCIAANLECRIRDRSISLSLSLSFFFLCIRCSFPPP